MKIRTKRLLGVGVAAALALGLLTGCGSKSEGEAAGEESGTEELSGTIALANFSRRKQYVWNSWLHRN